MRVTLRLSKRHPQIFRRAMATTSTPPRPFALKSHGGFIDGRWVEIGSGKGKVEVVNPATGRLVATLPDMGRSETDDAIAAAKAAFPGWAARTAGDRCAALRRLHDLMAKNLDGPCARPRGP
jgi:succinate-semialdehyde dehydrogenase/glutarate-semialdehyde dehydrogenase